jgi:hypothetical protein
MRSSCPQDVASRQGTEIWSSEKIGNFPAEFIKKISAVTTYSLSIRNYTEGLRFLPSGKQHTSPLFTFGLMINKTLISVTF